MKVIVLGSGVIGVSVAHQLAVDGHEVTVFDRQPAVALETSYANAGEVSPGYSAPWAGPGVPLKAIKWLAMHHRPLVIRPHLDLALLRWVASMLRNCTSERYDINKGRMVRLAEYSRDCLRELRAQTGISYDERMRGTLQLFRTQKQFDDSASDIAVLQRSGVAFELLPREGCIIHEPALADVREKFVGGLLLPGDETGDCFKFTQALASRAADLGVTFRQQTRVRRLLRRGACLEGVEIEDLAPALDHAMSIRAMAPGVRATSVSVDHCSSAVFPAAQGRCNIVSADAYVVALGSHSPLLLAPVGVDVPVYPVKGYSITVPIVDASGAPESTVMDETHKVAITRLGDRIRVGGMAELAGYTLRLDDARRQTLAHVVGDLFPRGGDLARAEFWCGLRPMTPDGTPVIGATPIDRLFLATGHGTLGWTMAAGTARVLADVIGARRTEIDLSGLGIERYARR